MSRKGKQGSRRFRRALRASCSPQFAARRARHKTPFVEARATKNCTWTVSKPSSAARGADSDSKMRWPEPMSGGVAFERLTCEHPVPSLLVVLVKIHPRLPNIDPDTTAAYRVVPAAIVEFALARSKTIVLEEQLRHDALVHARHFHPSVVLGNFVTKGLDAFAMFCSSFALLVSFQTTSPSRGIS